MDGVGLLFRTRLAVGKLYKSERCFLVSSNCLLSECYRLLTMHVLSAVNRKAAWET